MPLYKKSTEIERVKSLFVSLNYPKIASELLITSGNSSSDGWVFTVKQIVDHRTIIVQENNKVMVCKKGDIMITDISNANNWSMVKIKDCLFQGRDIHSTLGYVVRSSSKKSL